MSDALPFLGSLRLGGLVIDPPLLLAPMAGYTHAPFRALCRRRGCGLAFTEVITAAGIARRVPATLHYLTTWPGERPVAAHIYGAEPQAMADAARVIESLGQFDLIDINCGCPAPKITRKGAGVALMRDPDRVYAIVRAVVRATALPVTVKTRIGLSPDEASLPAVAQAVEAGGAQALFVHARFAIDQHTGPVHLDALRRAKQERAIPVIGNGGIRTGPNAARMLRETGVDGLMIGRAALGNPWVFDEVRCYLAGQPYAPPSADERLAVLAEHLHGLYQQVQVGHHLQRRPRFTDEGAACRQFRGHLARYLAGVPHASRWRVQLLAAESIAEVLTAAAQALAG
ncbi:MAG: tRNA-dihydrouridine synthase [Chloroflexi bacterium]|nr:tRNA-dihydrouridine synthase [Chloroflexota bacterium]